MGGGNGCDNVGVRVGKALGTEACVHVTKVGNKGMEVKVDPASGSGGACKISKNGIVRCDAAASQYVTVKKVPKETLSLLGNLHLFSAKGGKADAEMGVITRSSDNKPATLAQLAKYGIPDDYHRMIVAGDYLGRIIPDSLPGFSERCFERSCAILFPNGGYYALPEDPRRSMIANWNYHVILPPGAAIVVEGTESQ